MKREGNWHAADTLGTGIHGAGKGKGDIKGIYGHKNMGAKKTSMWGRLAQQGHRWRSRKSKYEVQREQQRTS